MDRITKALLDEYTHQNDIGSLSEDKRFEHFVSYVVISKEYADFFDTNDVVSGSGGDSGIDALGIIVNGNLITDSDQIKELVEGNGFLECTFIFAQVERSSSFDMQKLGQFGYGVGQFFSEDSVLPINDFIKNSKDIMIEIYNNASKFTRGNPICKLYYATTGTWTNDRNLGARMRTIVRDLKSLQIFREVEFIPIDASNLQKLYNQTKNSISRQFTFTNRTVVPPIEGVSEAYIGLLPAIDFIKLLEDENSEIIKSIFYDNVRDFQNLNAVNSEIKETIASTDKSRFALMNNGVTIIANTLRVTGNLFFIEDYQIVNGCQTSHVLHLQKEIIDDSVMVPLRLISTQSEAITSSIIKATNRQTQVSEDQLLALSDFQKRIESFFSSYEENKKLYYERRSKQYNSVVGIEKTRIVPLGNLIRSFASMFLQEPHRATRYYKTLLEQVGRNIFAPNHKLDPYYTSAYALYRLEYMFRNQTSDPKYKIARYHLLLTYRFIVNKSKLPFMN